MPASMESYARRRKPACYGYSCPMNFAGIRRAEDAGGDQKRVAGPAEAIRNGSSYLVIGRPITRAESPENALKEFNSAIASHS